VGPNENREGEGGQTGVHKLQLGRARCQHTDFHRSTANAGFQASSVSQSCKAANVKPEVVLTKQLIVRDRTEPRSRLTCEERYQRGRLLISAALFYMLQIANCGRPSGMSLTAAATLAQSSSLGLI